MPGATAAGHTAARSMIKGRYKPDAPHWFQVRNTVIAGLILAAVAGIWKWTSDVTGALSALSASVQAMHHESDGAEATRIREMDALQGAIVRDLNIDERRIAELERCACRS